MPPWLPPLLVGVVLGIAVSHIRAPAPAARSFAPTGAPRLLADLPRQGVSHNPEIAKRVLAARGVLPHVTQIAEATLTAGQVAARNSHVDMVELFLFLEGDGILELGDANYTVGAGHYAVINPPTPHTIYNGDGIMRLLTVAAA